MFAMIKNSLIIASLLTLLFSCSNITVANSNIPQDALSVQTFMDYNKDGIVQSPLELMPNVTVYLIKDINDFSAIRALNSNNNGIAYFGFIDSGDYIIDTCNNIMKISSTDSHDVGTLILFNCLHSQVYFPFAKN